MLIGNSLPEYAFIRIVIFFFRSIAPVSIAYTIYAVGIAISPASRHLLILPWPIEIYLFVEAAFCILVYLPLKTWLQNAAVHPQAPSKAERKVLFQHCLDSVSNPDDYLSGWFLGASVEEIKRDNFKELLAWSFMNSRLEDISSDESIELDSYLDVWETKCGRSLEPGRGKARSLRGTFDHVPMQHRPLVWYLIVSLVDLFTRLRLHYQGFSHYRPSIASTLFVLPSRTLMWLCRRQKQPGKLSYWYREHTSQTKLPIVFIHGIGVGLYTYVDFVAQLAHHQKESNDDGQVGLIVLEILPISARIAPAALSTGSMKAELSKILADHGWNDFALVGHSYGTAIASTLLRDAEFSQRIKATMLMDPICFLLHLPDIAYNFTRRQPRRANERMLHYFASQDMLISHTLARRFFWSEYILWESDIADLPVTVVLSGRDLIVPTKAVWNYLTDSASFEPHDGEPQALKGAVEWKDGKREVLWFNDFDHAGLFASKGARRGVAEIAHRLCAVG